MVPLVSAHESGCMGNKWKMNMAEWGRGLIFMHMSVLPAHNYLVYSATVFQLYFEKAEPQRGHCIAFLLSQKSFPLPAPSSLFPCSGEVLPHSVALCSSFFSTFYFSFFFFPLSSSVFFGFSIFFLPPPPFFFLNLSHPFLISLFSLTQLCHLLSLSHSSGLPSSSCVDVLAAARLKDRQHSGCPSFPLGSAPSLPMHESPHLAGLFLCSWQPGVGNSTIPWEVPWALLIPAVAVQARAVHPYPFLLGSEHTENKKENPPSGGLCSKHWG